MKALLSALLAATALLWLAGCASTKKDDVDLNGEQQSTIPWNRPQSWESGGALGGAMGH